MRTISAKELVKKYLFTQNSDPNKREALKTLVNLLPDSVVLNEADVGFSCDFHTVDAVVNALIRKTTYSQLFVVVNWVFSISQFIELYNQDIVVFEPNVNSWIIKKGQGFNMQKSATLDHLLRAVFYLAYLKDTTQFTMLDHLVRDLPDTASIFEILEIATWVNNVSYINYQTE